MKYTSYEQMLEDQATGGPDTCTDCKSFLGRLCGNWVIKNGEEVFEVCETCNGTGEV